MNLLETHAARTGELLLSEAQQTTTTPEAAAQVNVNLVHRIPDHVNSHVPVWDALVQTRQVARHIPSIAERRFTRLVRQMAAPKVSYGQKIVWMLEAAAFDLAAAIARLFPVDAVSDFGASVFRTIGPWTSVSRVAERNLRLVFPDANHDEINRLMIAQWEELGRSMAEFPIVDRIVADTERIRVTGVTRLHQIAAGDGPVVFISGHFSNIEVMAAAIVASGVPCQVTYRAMNNPYVDERVRKGRARYGVRLFAPKGLEGARELMRAIARGESIALLNDQKFNGGVAAPFFGKTVHTAPGPSTFALRFGIPLQPMSVQRRGKARFEVIVHEPIYLDDTGDRDADIEAGVRRVNAFIEDCVRARPTEWFWVHKRWPSEVYREPLPSPER